MFLLVLDFLGRPSFIVSEPTEEEKQLAEQAKEYGKMRQQSVLGEEQGAESEEPPPPGKFMGHHLLPFLVLYRRLGENLVLTKINFH